MTLRIAFVPGVTPDKWAGRWRERERESLELLPIEEADQAETVSSGVAEMVFVRLPLGGPAELADSLHQIRLYDEQPFVVAGVEHPVAASDEVPAEDLADEQFPLGVPGSIPAREEQLAFPAMTVREGVEVVASGTGVAVLPQSVARLYHRKDVVARPVLGLPATTIALVWPREADSDRLQRFVGIVKGRGSRSSR